MSAISLHTRPIPILRRARLARTAARFAVVGALGTLLDMALFAALHLALGLAALPANALSYSAGILNNFLLHRRWTYANDGRGQVLKQLSLARAAGAEQEVPADTCPTIPVGRPSLAAARASEDSSSPNDPADASLAGRPTGLLMQFVKFAAGPNGQILKQFTRFAAVSLTALALNTLVVLLLAPALQIFLPDALAALAAKACATAVGMTWNFLANHWWTFRSGE